MSFNYVQCESEHKKKSKKKATDFNTVIEMHWMLIMIIILFLYENSCVVNREMHAFQLHSRENWLKEGRAVRVSTGRVINTHLSSLN